jgi:hypothetical protein
MAGHPDKREYHNMSKAHIITFDGWIKSPLRWRYRDDYAAGWTTRIGDLWLVEAPPR